MSKQEQIMEKYKEWLHFDAMTPELLTQLKDMQDAEIKESFYRDLEFGTGGLRGILGPGTNRMNIYTVRRTTQGFADYINKHYGVGSSIAIAYDSRLKSDEFAQNAAGVMAANGIKVYIYSELMPTPALSFAVRYFKAKAGIVITASHNPSKYNGYKAYNDEGCQLTLEAAEDVLNRIEKVDMFEDVRFISFNEGLKPQTDDAGGQIGPAMIQIIKPEVTEAYLDAVQAESMSPALGYCPGKACLPLAVPSKTMGWTVGRDHCNCKLNVVYTPLNGAGNHCVRSILERIGLKRVTVVPEQEQPDGYFPTCPYPNPEKKEALAKGLALCSKMAKEADTIDDIPDILLATDPDCDRVGIAVHHPLAKNTTNLGAYLLLTGNEVGVLLLDFICRVRSGRIQGDSAALRPDWIDQYMKIIMPTSPVTVKTIVTTKMVDEVARDYGVEVINVLTGFKFIGEQIGFLEKLGQESRYIFGFEESYGYLAGSYVRDKDAVNGAMLICEMAAYYKQQGLSLVDAMTILYNKYGHYKNDLLDFGFEGSEGMKKMAAIMKDFRENPPQTAAGKTVIETADYLRSERKVAHQTRINLIDLPKSDVLEYILEDGSSFIVRPSGTEPKIKIYLSAKGETSDASAEMVEKLAKELSLRMVI